MTTRPHVYIYKNPLRKLEPFYVGHSITRRRARKHWLLGQRHSNPDMRAVFAALQAAGLEPVIERQYLDDVQDALRLEVELIAKWGRKHIGTGSLCNRSAGGEGAGSEAIRRFFEENPECLKQASERGRKVMVDLLSDPDFAKETNERLAAGPEALRKLLKNPEFAKAHFERVSEGRLHRLATDPQFATEHAERSRKNMLKLHANPEFAKAHSERGRESARKNFTPEWRTAQADKMRKPPKPRRSRSDPEYIQQARERIARLRMNPEFKEKHAAGSRSHMRDLWASPEGRAKMRAAQAAGHARKRAAKLAAEAAKSAPAGSIPANDNGAKALAA